MDQEGGCQKYKFNRVASMFRHRQLTETLCGWIAAVIFVIVAVVAPGCSTQQNQRTPEAESQNLPALGSLRRLPRTAQQRLLPIYVRILRSLRPVHERSVLACALLVSCAGLLLLWRRAPGSSTDKRGRRHSAICSGDAHCCGVSSTERADGLPALRRFQRRNERLRRGSHRRRTAVTTRSHHWRMHL